MDFFKNKVVIITGSSMGIGKATAIELARRGANVIINGRDQKRLLRTETELRNAGFNVLAVQADVSSFEDCQKLVNKTIEVYGKLDILVNNAGISMRGRFGSLSPDVSSQVISTNILGTIYPSQLALPHLMASKGSLVMISSIAAIRGLPNISVYCASKMALTALAGSLRVELAGSGVSINIIYVGRTQNSAERKVLNHDGTLITLKERTHRSADTREEVAKAIARSIEKRRSITTRSFLGKFNIFMTRFFPRISDQILIRSVKMTERYSK